jgi:ABC-type cobalamin transport system ATPase subunit
MHYPSFWFKLQALERLEKLAHVDDQAVAAEAQEALALACDDMYSSVKQASGAILPTVFKMRESHRITGEKLAASPDTVAELLQKLATAEYVDEMLAGQLEKLSGEEYDAARAVQLLGREYAVQLMRGLFA